jgi:hypothetical protein
MFSVYLKRKTGTGDVIVDMGPSSATTSLSSVSWTRAFVVATTLTGTYASTSGTYTVTTALNHGFSTGDAIRFDATSGAGADVSVASITVTGLNQFTFVNGVATTSGNCSIYSNTGKIRIQTNGDEVYAWGAQIESTLLFTSVSSPVIFPSSYIPTTTAQVTKQSDATITNFNGSSNCSLYFELSKNGGSQLQANPFLMLGNETGPSISSDYLILYGNSNNSNSFYKRENSGAVTVIVNSIPYNANAAYTKSLLTVSGNTIRLWMDGSQVALSTFANPSLLKYLSLQQNSGSTIRLKQLAGWNRTLSIAEAQALTSYNYPLYDAGYTPLNSELQQVINRASFEGFTIPTPTQLGYCDILITDMKSNGIWDISDVFFNFSYNDVNLSNFARINWKNPYGPYALSTYVGGTSYEVTGIRITSANTGYVDTNYNPANSGINYTTNSASRFAVISNNANGFYVDGTISNNLRNHITNGFNSTGLVGFNSAFGVQTGTPLTINIQAGLTGIVRYDSTNISVIQKSVIQNTTLSSNGILSSNQSISRAGSFAWATYSSYFMGASITNTQVQNFRTAYNTYLVSIGLTAYA